MQEAQEEQIQNQNNQAAGSDPLDQIAKENELGVDNAAEAPADRQDWVHDEGQNVANDDEEGDQPVVGKKRRRNQLAVDDESDDEEQIRNEERRPEKPDGKLGKIELKKEPEINERVREQQLSPSFAGGHLEKPGGGAPSAPDGIRLIGDAKQSDVPNFDQPAAIGQASPLIPNDLMPPEDRDQPFSQNQADQANQNTQSQYDDADRSDTREDGVIIKKTEFVIKNGCCMECMKAFSKSGKSCLCQVPKNQRRAVLPPTGCKYCNCKGCNPADVIKQKRQELKTKLKQDGFGKFSRKHQRLLESDDDENNLNELGLVSLGTGQQNKQYDEWNRAKHELTQLMESVTGISALLMGIGTPLRHQSYIFGRPPENATGLQNAQQKPSPDMVHLAAQLRSPQAPASQDQVPNSRGGQTSRDRSTYSPTASSRDHNRQHDNRNRRDNSQSDAGGRGNNNYRKNNRPRDNHRNRRRNQDRRGNNQHDR